jgi:hypothetical protein
MSKSLENRLLDAKTELSKANAVMARHASKLPAEVASQFQSLLAFGSDVEHWREMIQARSAARRLLDGLEDQADENDLVPLGAHRAKYQHVRLIGVQACLATQWALADRLVGMVGQVLCTAHAGIDPSQPAQLVAHFVQDGRKKTTAAALYRSVRETFGWPIGISYALRNHFVHDGGQMNGIDFFDGPTPRSGFAISTKGWARIEDKARTYGIDPTHQRPGSSWPAAPEQDLRAVLDVCGHETDDALGILVSSACRSLVAHVGCMLGED